jgi:hypothetical protein
MLTKGKSKKASKLQQKSWHKIIQKHVFNEHLKAYRKQGDFFNAKNEKKILIKNRLERKKRKVYNHLFSQKKWQSTPLSQI